MFQVCTCKYGSIQLGTFSCTPVLFLTDKVAYTNVTFALMFKSFPNTYVMLEHICFQDKCESRATVLA